MWPRVVELMLGLWLMASPFIFRLPETDVTGFAGYFLYGIAVVAFSILSYWNRTRRAHLLTLLIAGWLVVSAFAVEYPVPPSAQNRLIVGLLLAMFAIIPSPADEMPKSWKEFYQRNGVAE